MFSKILLLLYALLITTTWVSAIPPPDALASVWQSLLQILGVASVFIAGAFYSVKQYLGASWKRAIFISLGLTAIVGAGILISAFVSNNTFQTTQTPPKTKPPTVSIPGYNAPANKIEGELLGIDAVIARETDKHTRDWKRQTYKEMVAEANHERHKAGLANIALETIRSFKPERLYQYMNTSPEKLFFLDVRGPYEQKMFHLPLKKKQFSSAHYGDLVHEIIPEDLQRILPKDKLIIVLCHSGLRGYLAANTLKHQGFDNVAFLQGGLANWNKLKLPVEGDENYSLDLSHYKNFSEYEARQLRGVQKVEIDPGEGFKKDMPGLIHLPYELATSTEIDKVIKASRQKAVLIVCRRYAGCFHSLNFGYTIEQAGGKVAGVFDRSGEFLVPDEIPLVE